MAGKKYGKYILKHSLVYGDFGPKICITGETDFNSDFSIICLPVTKPVLMEEHPHSHDFDIYLTFIGFGPGGLEELGAEIEMSLGEEREKFVITSNNTLEKLPIWMVVSGTAKITSCGKESFVRSNESVYIPKGLVHCPLGFKRVDKPVLLVHSSLASKYTKKEPVPG